MVILHFGLKSIQFRTVVTSGEGEWRQRGAICCGLLVTVGDRHTTCVVHCPLSMSAQNISA